MKNNNKDIHPAKIFSYCFIGLILFVLLMMSFKTVDAGTYGVKLTFGKPSPYSLEPGFHWKIPFAQRILELETRTQKIEVIADSSSKDLQDVQVTIALNFHVEPTQVHKVYQNLGLDYGNRIVIPAIHEMVKAVSATFTAEELITKRPEVKSQAREAIKTKLKDYDLFVDDFNIVNFQFSEEFDKAIEAKVTAEQLKFKADMDLERIRVEALQREAEAIGIKHARIAEAQGEAEAIKVIEQQLKQSPQYLEWKKIDRWDGILPKVTGGAIPFIGIDTLMED